MSEPRRCPTCDSPDPKLHPAVQFEGEVQICKDPWHPPVADEGAASVPLTPAKCLDCGLDYAEFQMDVILPRSQWLEINPADSGLLPLLQSRSGVPKMGREQ